MPEALRPPGASRDPRASAFSVFARATRLKTAPLIVVPVGIGTALGAARTGRIDWLLFVVAAIGAVLALLAANALNDVFDAQTGADRIAGMDRTAVVTASGLIDAGRLRARAMATIGIALAAGAGGIGAWLAVTRDPSIAWIAIAGAALGVFYVGPPIRYAYLGHGLGEAGIIAAFGVLPVAGAAAVQAQEVWAGAWRAGVIPGALTMLVFFHHNLLHHKADRAVRKRTPAAILGPEAALIAGAALIVATYAGLAVEVATGLYPSLALVGMLPSIPLFGAWARAFRDPNPPRLLNLLGACLGASVLSGAWLAVAVWIG